MDFYAIMYLFSHFIVNYKHQRKKYKQLLKVEGFITPTESYE